MGKLKSCTKFQVRFQLICPFFDLPYTTWSGLSGKLRFARCKVPFQLVRLESRTFKKHKRVKNKRKSVGLELFSQLCLSESICLASVQQIGELKKSQLNFLSACCCVAMLSGQKHSSRMVIMHVSPSYTSNGVLPHELCLSLINLSQMSLIMSLRY